MIIKTIQFRRITLLGQTMANPYLDFIVLTTRNFLIIMFITTITTIILALYNRLLSLFSVYLFENRICITAQLLGIGFLRFCQPFLSCAFHIHVCPETIVNPSYLFLFIY